jgi:hypothetical protein
MRGGAFKKCEFCHFNPWVKFKGEADIGKVGTKLTLGMWDTF